MKVVQIDRACKATIVDGEHTVFGWSYLYTYLLGHVRFTIFMLQKVVSMDVIITKITRLANYIRLYDLDTQ